MSALDRRFARAPSPFELAEHRELGALLEAIGGGLVTPQLLEDLRAAAHALDAAGATREEDARAKRLLRWADELEKLLQGGTP